MGVACTNRGWDKEGGKDREGEKREGKIEG